MTEPRTICVFCGSSAGHDPRYLALAQALGTMLGEQGHGLVYGGGHVGLMGAVADAALEAGAPVTGVITEQLVDAEVAHLGLTTLEILPTMHARKARMADLADGVVVLPGGFGTWEEAFEVLTWNQLGLVSMPVVFLDEDGFFEPLFAFIGGAVEAGFLKQANADFAARASDPAEALSLASGPAVSYEPKWVGRADNR